MRWSVVSPCVAVALGAMGAGARGGGADDAGIEIADGVPFSAEELREAVRLRAGEDVTLIVRPGGQDGEDGDDGPDGAVVVIVADRARTVVLSGLRGAAAARKVALLVLDLLEGEGAGAGEAGAAATAVAGVVLDPVEVPRLTMPPAPLSGMSDDVGPGPAPAAAPEVPRWRVIAQTGAGTSEALRLALSLERAVAGPVRVVGGAGFAAAIAREDATLRRVPMWIGAGAATRRAGVVIDAHAAALASIDRVVVDDGGVERARVDLQWGGTVDVGLARPVGRHAALGLRVGLDAHATSTEYRLGGEAVLATPRLVPWLALSLAMSLSSRAGEEGGRRARSASERGRTHDDAGVPSDDNLDEAAP